MQPQNFSHTESLNILLSLLDKAEQILSLVNLSDTSISKYNKLKEMTFDQLNLRFTPLIKRPSSQLQRPTIPDNLIYLLQTQSIKKSMFIDVILDYCERQPKEVDLNFYLNQIDKIFNYTQPSISLKTIDELDYEIKIADKKLKDLFCKFNELIHNKNRSLKTIVNDYENKISDMKNMYEKEIFALKEQINKYVNIESDLFTLRKHNEMNEYIIDKMSRMVSVSYEKIIQGNSNWYGGQRYSEIGQGEEFPAIEKLSALIQEMDKCHAENKQLNDIVPTLQREKHEMSKEHNLPYVENVIAKNDIVQSLCLDIDEVERSNESFHRNFQDLINYISENVEGKIN